jgi:hypothetical protein
VTDPLKILSFYLKRGISPEKIPTKSVFGKIYWEWRNSPAEIELPEGYKFNSINLLIDAPIPYEVEYGLSNWVDCVDWLKENFITADTRFPLNLFDIKPKTDNLVVC